MSAGARHNLAIAVGGLASAIPQGLSGLVVLRLFYFTPESTVSPEQAKIAYFGSQPAAKIEQWMTTPAEDALKLQRPLPDGTPTVVATGE